MNGDVQIRVDYMLRLRVPKSSSLMSVCHTLSMDYLKSSKHLPLLVDMMYVPSQEDLTEGALSQGIDWDKARRFWRLYEYS